MISEDAEQRTIEEAWAISSYKEAIAERKANQAAWAEYLRKRARTLRAMGDELEERAERVANSRVDEGIDLKRAPLSGAAGSSG